MQLKMKRLKILAAECAGGLISTALIFFFLPWRGHAIALMKAAKSYGVLRSLPEYLECIVWIFLAFRYCRAYLTKYRSSRKDADSWRVSSWLKSP